MEFTYKSKFETTLVVVVHLRGVSNHLLIEDKNVEALTEGIC